MKRQRMEKKILEIKNQARNTDIRDLRRVVQNLADALLEVYKLNKGEKITKKPIRKTTKAKVKTLANK